MLSSALDTLGNDLSSPGSDEPTQLKPGPSAADFSGSPKERGFASSESLLGADEDEIGAVFDQVLSGDKQRPRLAEAASEDDRESTRVLDAGLAKRLAEESGSGPESSREVPQLDAPQTDWYVAINEKQMGPLSLEAVKAHWDHGEIGPDSLCWRQGQGDWLPVSEVKDPCCVLAPKPPRPIVVPAAATVSSSMSAGAVVSVPVQSAFSAGGVVHTVQSEMQVPMGGTIAGGIVAGRPRGHRQLEALGGVGAGLSGERRTQRAREAGRAQSGELRRTVAAASARTAGFVAE